MTTQKAQSKFKSSTVAITVLSILLAIAVVSTIVLAAFTATKSANTTITFGGGQTLTLSSATNADFGTAGADSDGTFVITPTNTAFAGAVTVPAISGQLSLDGFVGFKIWAFHYESQGSPAWGSATPITDETATTVGQVSVTVTAAENVELSSGVFYYNGGESGLLTAGSPVELISSISINATDYNQVTGDKVSIAIVFYAESQSGEGSLANVQGYSYATPSAPSA